MVVAKGGKGSGRNEGRVSASEGGRGKGGVQAVERGGVQKNFVAMMNKFLYQI